MEEKILELHKQGLKNKEISQVLFNKDFSREVKDTLAKHNLYPNGKSVRFTYDYVKELFEKEGCALLSQEYKNARSKLDYICSCGNKSSIVLESFRMGNRCNKCGTRKGADKQVGIFRKGELKGKSVEEVLPQYGFESLGITGKKIRFKCKECSQIFNKPCQETMTLIWRDQIICYHNFPKEENNKNRRNSQKKFPLRKRNVNDKIFFRQKCTAMVRNCLKAIDQEKDSKTYEILGYSNEDLRDWIKSFPQYQDLRNKNTLSIDHILPIEAFLKNNIFDLKIINALDNLQPMDILKNISKSDNYNKNELRQYLLSKGITKSIDELL